jgi:hypothetical protein
MAAPPQAPFPWYRKPGVLFGCRRCRAAGGSRSHRDVADGRVSTTLANTTDIPSQQVQVPLAPAPTQGPAPVAPPPPSQPVIVQQPAPRQQAPRQLAPRQQAPPPALYPTTRHSRLRFHPFLRLPSRSRCRRRRRSRCRRRRVARRSRCRRQSKNRPFHQVRTRDRRLGTRTASRCAVATLDRSFQNRAESFRRYAVGRD